MSNMLLGCHIEAEVESLREVVKNIRDLTLMKSKLVSSITNGLAIDEFGCGTHVFEDTEGGIGLTVTVSEDLVVDNDKLKKIIPSLKKRGIYEDLVTVSYKVDKRKFDKLSKEDLELFDGCIKRKKKSPSLDA